MLIDLFLSALRTHWVTFHNVWNFRSFFKRYSIQTPPSIKFKWETISYVRRYAVETVHTGAACADVTDGKGKSGSSSSICATYGGMGQVEL